MISFGNNAHIFARPSRRESLKQLFETTLKCGPVLNVDYPGMAEPMLLIRFPKGGALSIEITPDADDSDEPRRAAWLELRSPDPPAVIDALRAAGIPEVKHPGHPFYFMAPGGQVFTVVQADP
jgi:hypothetical protein